MSEEEAVQEYTVEATVEAKAKLKRSVRLTWIYYVKWKEYEEKYNTWEPEESFEGAEHFIHTFWENADLRGKDKSDANQFKRGDKVHLIAPGSKRKSRRKSEGDAPPPAEPDESEQEPEVQPVKRDHPSKAPRTYKKPSRRKSMPERARPKPVASSSKKRKFEPSDSSDADTVPLTKVGPPGKRRVKRKLGNHPQPKLNPVDDPPHQDPETTGADENEPPAEPGAISVDDLFSSPALPRPAPRSSGVFSVLAVDSESERENGSESGSRQSATPLPASRRVPAHRERAANPRIKMMEETGVDDSMKDAIAVKTRIVSKTTTTTRTITKVPSNLNVRPPSSSAKPGPGRSSQGLLNTDRPEDDTPNGNGQPQHPEPGNLEAPSSLRLLVDDVAKEVNAAGLEDFDDAMQVETNVETTISEVTPAEKTVMKTPSLGEAGRTKSWPKFGQTSIFGLLGIGGSKSSKATQDTFPINLDSLISVYVILKDVHPATKLHIPDLITIIGQVPHPPGKFYKPDAGAILLASLKTGGPSARLEVEPATDETGAQHFSRFRERLENGDIFITMAGETILTIVSSQNQEVCEKLGIPEALRGLSSEIVMSAVVIEDISAYGDAASNLADNSRWL